MTDRRRQVLRFDETTSAEHNRSLETVLELSYVSGIRIADKCIQGLRRHPVHYLPVFLRMLPNEVLDKQGDVAAPVSQGGDHDRYHVESKIKVLPEPTFLQHAFQVLMGCCDNPHIRSNGRIPAHSLERTLLNDVEQFDLHGQGQVPDLVDEKRSPVRLFESSDPHAVRTGERTLFVAEKLALQHAGGKGRAIDGKERFGRPVTGQMNRICQQPFARPAFSSYQDGRHAAGHPGGQIHGLLHGAAFPDDLIKPVPFRKPLPEFLVLLDHRPM